MISTAMSAAAEPPGRWPDIHSQSHMVTGDEFSAMNPWIAKAVIRVAVIVMAGIRVPYSLRSRGTKVVWNRNGRWGFILSTLAMIGLLLPLIWAASPVFSFAEYPLTLGPLVLGIACLAGGLWLLYRSHRDLEANWSSTLQIREHHRLVTQGVYPRVRHPMYSAFLLYALGQVMVIPNWVAGPSSLVTFVILIASRIRDEEGMMLNTFGQGYATYAARTRRLIPGVW